MTGRYWDERLETLPTERRRLLREHRLHWQVRRCWDASPFYRARLEAAGLDPVTFGGLTDWHRVPIVHSGDLPPATESGEPSPGWTVAPEVWWEQEIEVGATCVRVLTDGDVTHQADLAARALWAAGGRPGRYLAFTPDPGPGPDRSAVVAGAARISMATREQPTGASASADTTLVAWAHTWPPSDASGTLDGGGVSVPPVGPTLAYACGEGDGVHWIDDHFLIEIVDPRTGQSVPEGSTGGLVVTDLVREGSPLLRYWTGREAALVDQPCPCGRTTAQTPFVGRGSS